MGHDQQCNRPFDSTDKKIIAIFVALLYIIFSSPCLFNFVNSITSKVGILYSNSEGLPTAIGILGNAILLGFLIRILIR